MAKDLVEALEDFGKGLENSEFKNMNYHQIRNKRLSEKYADYLKGTKK